MQRSLLVSALATLSLSLSAHATVIFTNFASPDPMSTGHTWGIAGSAAGPTPFYNAYASSFTPSAPAIAQSVDIPLFQNSDYDPAAVVELLDTGLNGFPSTVLATTDTITIPDSPVGPQSASFILPATLVPGVQYWIAVLPATPTSGASWEQNPALAQPVSFSSDGVNWSDSGFGLAGPGEFTINGTLLPEPASLSVLVPTLLLFRRKR